MKTKFYKIFSLLVIIVVTTFSMTSCNDELENVTVDDRLFGKDSISITHPNPRTNLPYTASELAQISYNPSKEEFYTQAQPVNLTINLAARPLKVEVISTSEKKNLKTLENFTAGNNGFFTANFTTNVIDLGVNAGSSKSILFNVTYDDVSDERFQYPSLQSISFKVNNRTSPFTFLQKKSGEKIDVFTLNNASSIVEDATYGSIVTFDGVNDLITLGKDSQLDFRHSGDFSIGVWVNTTSTGSDPSIVGDKDWGSGGNKGFVMAFRGNNTWKVNAGDGNGNRVDANGGNINDGKWHHLLTTFDRDGMMTVYQDGIKLSEVDMSALGDMNSGLPIRMGQDGTGTYGKWFEGKTGEMTIYNYVLDDAEASIIGSNANGVELRKKSGEKMNLNYENKASSGPVAENGRLAFTFDGTDDLVTLEKTTKLDFTNAGDFSISLWVNTTSTVSDPSMIGNKDWNSGGNKGFILAYKGNTWKANVGDGSGNRADLDGLAVGDGNWHHIVVTFDRDGMMTLYQDSVKIGETNMSAVGDMTSGLPIRLAQEGTGSYGKWFGGKLADVKILDYVLDQNGVNALFN